MPPLLEEFRTALRDEIEVAKRNSASSAIPLSNGHRVAHLGSAFQYAFMIDSVLNAPDGAPGDLIVPGKAPLQVTIVSVEGLRIVISLEYDLGKYVPIARLQTNLTILMRKLIERIEVNASSTNEAASRMLGTSPVTGAARKLQQFPKRLNQSQGKALESALCRNLTVIWGPPGTGKTHTIGTIAKHLFNSGRTVLIVSHTNIAVDQAIRNVARAMPEHVHNGDIIRIGEVRDDVLKLGFPDVLLKKQVERQSKELIEQRAELVSRRQNHSDKLHSLERKIEVAEWVEVAQDDIRSCEKKLSELQIKEDELTSCEQSLAQIEVKRPELLELHRRAASLLSLRAVLAAGRDKKKHLELLLRQNDSDCNATADSIKEHIRRLEIVHRITPLRQELATYPKMAEQKLVLSRLSVSMVEAISRVDDLQCQCDNANRILDQSRNTGAVMRLWKHLPRPDDQQIVINDLCKQVATANAERAAIENAHEAAKNKLSRVIELDNELSQHSDIGDESAELAKQKTAQERMVSLKRDRSKLIAELETITYEITKIEIAEKDATASFEGNPEDVLSQVDAELRRHKQIQEMVHYLRSHINLMRTDLLSVLSQILHHLIEWELISIAPVVIKNMLEVVIQTHTKISAEYNPTSLPILREEAVSLRLEIGKINSEIAVIDVRLGQVEKAIIANAAIIGATLTKTYLSDDLHARKFDTVILDEASMAPIPALWAAALLSDNNLIIVGDFKQLPPIVLSTNPLTKKWLGRDIFEASGLEAAWEKRNIPDWFIALDEQRRMLPQIAEIANLFYDDILRTPPGLHDPEYAGFLEWYNKEWQHDNPVVLVDTESLNAWVTSVVKSRNASRLNFLSATVAVDLAEQLLRPDRADRIEGAPKRVMIIAPYRAHAKLVSILLRENSELQNDVIAGTAHSFQGSEAEVVIFDLVVDEPHFRVNLFIPALDEQMKRLLNVGMTRAKYRLFILGDFSYCQKLGKKAFLGKELIPFLTKKFTRIDALQLVPEGLASRAAKAQMTMLGGEIEPDSARIVVTQADFFRLLSSDILRARNRIIIYSPFITQDRLGFLMPQIQAALARGIPIFIITKSHSERSGPELQQVKKLEGKLSEIGVIVMHKMRMHEKLVFIDNDITWSGSLNPLSFSNTQEIMERRKSTSVLNDYFQILRLEELISVHGKPESKCPICGSEMVAAEGADEPYYWRCINEDCYSRGIDQPYPFDGLFTCSSCNAPVEYGYWGDYPHWRCTKNTRHRQKVFKSHLHLPKMAALIAKRERSKLCKLFQIDSFEKYVISDGTRTHTRNGQTTFFDEFK